MLQLLHTELHWLDLSERVVYKLSIMAYNCPHGQVPLYLTQLCQSVTGVASRQHLRSAARLHLEVPHNRFGIYGRRAFSVAGPSISNSLKDSILGVLGRCTIQIYIFLFLLIGSAALLRQLPLESSITRNNSIVQPATAVHVLGVWIDSELSMRDQVSHVSPGMFLSFASFAVRALPTRS